MRWTTLEERVAARREQALMRWMIGCGSPRPRSARVAGAKEPRLRRPRRRGAALLVVATLVVLWLIA